MIPNPAPAPQGETPTQHLSIDSVLAVIDAEPELPGTMPDEIWNAVCNDRDAVAELLRIAVRQTKNGIRDRVAALATGGTADAVKEG